MKSAAQMSMLIRAKKKAMKEDPGVVSLSGIPEDAQDLYAKHQMEITEPMDHNNPLDKQDAMPAESHMDDSMDMEKSQEMHEQDSPEKEQPEVDEMMMKRKARISKMMMG